MGERATDLDEIFASLPRIAAAGTQVEIDLIAWVRRARALGAGEQDRGVTGDQQVELVERARVGVGFGVVGVGVHALGAARREVPTLDRDGSRLSARAYHCARIGALPPCRR